MVSECNKVILVGGFHEVIEICESAGMSIVGIIDNELKGQYFGYPVLGRDSDANYLLNEFSEIPVVVTPDIPEIRRSLSAYYAKIGFRFCNAVHPDASISKYATLGQGVIIQNMVNLSTNVVIKNFAKLNTGANVMHDSVIGSYSTVAPNAVVLGKVLVGESCYIGANSTLLPEVKIGSHSTVGASAVVTKNVADHMVVAGNPAKCIGAEHATH